MSAMAEFLRIVNNNGHVNAPAEERRRIFFVKHFTPNLNSGPDASALVQIEALNFSRRGDAGSEDQRGQMCIR